LITIALLLLHKKKISTQDDGGKEFLNVYCCTHLNCDLPGLRGLTYRYLRY